MRYFFLISIIISLAGSVSSFRQLCPLLDRQHLEIRTGAVASFFEMQLCYSVVLFVFSTIAFILTFFQLSERVTWFSSVFVLSIYFSLAFEFVRLPFRLRQGRFRIFALYGIDTSALTTAQVYQRIENTFLEDADVPFAEFCKKHQLYLRRTTSWPKYCTAASRLAVRSGAISTIRDLDRLLDHSSFRQTNRNRL